MNDDIKKIVHEAFEDVYKQKTPNMYSLLLLATLSGGGTSLGLNVLGNSETISRSDNAEIIAEKEIRQQSHQDLQRQIIRIIDNQSIVNSDVMQQFREVNRRHTILERDVNSVEIAVDYLKRQRWADHAAPNK